ncbi:hypothetical protein NEOLEDRAFT_1138247 [Neolentinus lepideus HHB14362 ss-1]|uniref:Uncharacterized protein n=1 Tax=Neolentinus lepideus HHB14362 ss-1 TaxID=1314782 RepID=A0A165QEF4_9AGAM|nr:hypothetical protein NEOLEDRAFT_1138247 [Neolentinus lepideus HHB14362 ss-1]
MPRVSAVIWTAGSSESDGNSFARSSAFNPGRPSFATMASTSSTSPVLSTSEISDGYRILGKGQDLRNLASPGDPDWTCSHYSPSRSSCNKPRICPYSLSSNVR